MPEPFIVQTIASFLAHCPFIRDRCYAVDIGGNLGIHTAYMASLGADVDAIEPAVDLARVAGTTMRLNCWQDRVRIFNNFITADPNADGRKHFFQGGWRLDDRGAKNRRKHNISTVAVQHFLSRRIDLLKLDIDNSPMEALLLAAVAAKVARGEADVAAIVFEFTGARAYGRPGSTAAGRASSLADTLHRMQRVGYHAYRLAHHLHTIERLEPYYSACIGARQLRLALHIKLLSRAQWGELLALRADARLGRAEGTSFLLSRVAIGRGAEANWASESMADTMPAMWKRARCGAR